MRPWPDNRGTGWLQVAFSVLCLTLAAKAADAGRAPALILEPRGETLHLEVILNGIPSGLIGEFRRSADGRFFCRRRELAELGIVMSEGDADSFIEIGNERDLQLRYDTTEQRLHVEISDRLRERRVIDASQSPKAIAPPQSEIGGVLNYTLFAAASSESRKERFSFGRPNFDGANVSLDARLFTPLGNLNQTGILGTTTFSSSEALRLDTSWSYTEPTDALTYRAGDTITGGLAWTRPLRIGGFQAQRNFAVRPDLVTTALPQFSGSAAVPSVVDVYVNGLKTYTQEVGAGPFQINNLPVVTGAGEARVVVRDASGREVETTGSFYVSPQLLTPGLTDFSVEAGLPRLNYGQASFDYVETPVMSGSMRHGWTDALTLEGHAEVGGGLFNIGAGLVARAGDLGILSFAGAVSSFQGETGALGFAAFETQIMGLTFRGSAQHTFGDYNDLASLTAIETAETRGLEKLYGETAILGLKLNGKTPKALDTLSVGIPLTFDKSTLSLSYIHLETADEQTTNILNATYSRPFYFGGTATLTAYVDLDDRDNSGVYGSVSFPLGLDSTLTVGGSALNGRAGVVAEALKPLGADDGSIGWRVRAGEGDNVDRQATAAYRSKYARIEGGLRQDQSRTQASAEVEGAIAALGGKVYATNRIDDAFAIVTTGVPDVPVSYENRYIGRTDVDGDILVRGLRSFQHNKIEIDPSHLPVTAAIPTTTKIVVPGDRSGVAVDLTVAEEAPSAIVVIERKRGRYVAVGSRATLRQSGESSVVGYDGRVYLTGLSAHNVVEISAEDGTCTATFDFVPERGRQKVIGPVPCR